MLVVSMSAQKTRMTFPLKTRTIISSPGHAACYGVTGYYSAYIKAHFPLAFFTAWLKNAHHKQDPQQEVFELVNDARLFDIAVEPPDLLTLEPHFHTDGKVVKFGLAGIKGVGEAQIQKLKEARRPPRPRRAGRSKTGRGGSSSPSSLRKFRRP
jgi:DNA polymerase III alpha subunit